jgi:exodeoxyribonuclease-5
MSNPTHTQPPIVSQPINLNTATASELRGLPGVGPALARAILSDRDAAGEYARAEDLRRVPGVGPKILARIVGLVCCGGVAAAAGRLPTKPANDDKTPAAQVPAVAAGPQSQGVRKIFGAVEDIQDPPGMKWTQGQREAISAIRQHLRTKAGTIYMLRGYAGTGKTTLLVEALRGFASPVMLAPTHKAKSILEPKAEQLGGVADTAHRWLGYRQVINEDTGSTDFVRVPKDPRYKHPKWKPLIIDEISMMSAKMWAELVEEVRANGLMCVAMGDPLQLPPIGEDMSPAFIEPLPSSELTQVMRSSGVLTEAVLHVRGCVQSKTPPLVRQSADDDMSKVEHWTDKTGMLRDYFRVIQSGASAILLAWHNHVVDWANATLRRWAANGSPDPYFAGEVLVVTDSYSLDYLADSRHFDEGDEADLREIPALLPMLYSETRLRIITAERKRHPIWGDWCWALRVAELGFDAHPVLDAGVQSEVASKTWGPIYALDEQQKKTVARRRAEMREEFNRVRALADERGGGMGGDAKAGALKSQLARELAIYERAYISVRPGYATTVHKSQGSTWDHVYVAQGDICQNSKPFERNRLLYVAFSRAAKRLVVYG